MSVMYILQILTTLCAGAHAVPFNDQGVMEQDKNLIQSAASTNTPMVEHLDDLLRQLMVTGHYDRIFLNEDQGQYSLMAMPVHFIKNIEMTGEQNFSESDLMAQITVKAGDRFERNTAIQSGQKLKAFYGESGYYDAVIDEELTQDSDGQFTIHFHIDEKLPCRIQNVLVKTQNLDLERRLNETLKTYQQRVLSEKLRLEIQQQINDYLNDNHYFRTTLKDVSVQYNSAKTSVLLTYPLEDPYHYDVVPSGLEKISLIEFYQTLNLDHYERSGLDPVTILIEKIRAFYLKKGFAHVQVQTKIEDLPKIFMRRVRFFITEGPQVRFSQLNISGRISRPTTYYSALIIDTSSDLIQLGYYNRDDIETGTKNLVTDLKNQGFLRARVQSIRTEYSSDKKNAVVDIIVDEGPQTQVHEISFEGVQAFSPLELAEVIQIKVNAPLRLMDVETSLDLLKKFYYSRGYIEMKNLNSNEQLIEYNDRNTQASLHFKIYEGPQVRIGRIVVEGNTFTHSDVVMREISLHNGDLLTPDQIDESIVRLNKFGIFSHVEIKTLEENSTISERTVVISVTERDPGVFRYGAGINSSRNFSVRGFTGLSYNNIGGTGRAISGRVELNYNVAQVHYLENKVAAGYFEPFLFGTRTRGRINVSRTQFVFYYSDTAPPPDPPVPFTVIDTSNKIDFLLERDLTRHIKLTWTLLTADSQFTYDRNNLCIDPADNICSNTLRVNYIGPTLDFDYRDNPFLPTRGDYFRIDTSYADPLFGSSPDTKFIRTEGVYSHYIPLAPRWVWTNSLRSGYEKNFLTQQGSGIPASYAFFLGGFNTIRGFDSTYNNERIPPDYDIHFVYPTQRIIPVDSYYYLIKSEVRFPLYGDIGGVIFYDAGSVQVTDYHMQNPYRQGVGFGLRLNTPVGPASLDIGFKINPVNAVYYNPALGNVTVNEAPFRVYFYVGTF